MWEILTFTFVCILPAQTEANLKRVPVCQQHTPILFKSARYKF